MVCQPGEWRDGAERLSESRPSWPVQWHVLSPGFLLLGTRGSRITLARAHIQVINNSCGTIAALNAVMNIQPQTSPNPPETIGIGSELENLRDFGTGMTSME